ncbi:MAG TPA: SCO family protein [Pyrinomonadaceae bacterium]|nr:SCO family protein [Pyrinomonadaceae bacterium]
MKPLRTFSLVLVIATICFIPACRQPPQTANRYDLKGKVVSVDRDKQEVTIDHQEVKGFMPAMIMPFKLKDAWPLGQMAAGDQITAVLVVDRGKSWLEDVVIIQEGPLTPTAAGEEVIPAKPGDEVPNYGLLNQDNKAIKIHDYRGKALVLTFIYTRCPDPQFCTLMSSNFQQLDGELQKQPALYEKTHLLSISFDPTYDTPAVLRSYGAAYTGKYSDEKFDHWEFAGGSLDQIKGIAQYFGLRYYQNTDQIIHGLRTVIIAPDGKVYKVYDGNKWKPEELLSDLSELIK